MLPWGISLQEFEFSQSWGVIPAAHAVLSHTKLPLQWMGVVAMAELRAELALEWDSPVFKVNVSSTVNGESSEEEKKNTEGLES